MPDATKQIKVTYLPQTESVLVEFDSVPTSIIVYNLQGIMLRQTLSQESPAVISLTDLPSSTYIVTVYTYSGIMSENIMKR